MRLPPAPGTLVDIEGQRLHFVCAGSGEPAVLFEAGVAASSLSWTLVQGRVAELTRTCAYDRAGLGWSAPPRAPRTVTQMVSELHGVLGSAAMTSAPVLVGHSFGSFLVLAYASRFPGEVGGLVLLDPPTEWYELTGRRARMLWGGIQFSRLGAVLARLGVVGASLALLTGGAPGVPRTFVRVFGPTAARTLEHLVGEVRKLPAEVHPAVQALWSQPKCFHAMAHYLAALRETGAAAAAVRSLRDLPVAVISSRDQPPDMLERHRRLAGLSTRGRHLVAAKSGHWIQLDEPDLVIKTIREVVDQTRMARS